MRQKILNTSFTILFILLIVILYSCGQYGTYQPDNAHVSTDTITGSNTARKPAQVPRYVHAYLPEHAVARFGKGSVSGLAYSPDGNRLTLATSSGIYIHNSNTGKELMILPGGGGKVAYSPDGRFLATCQGNEVKVRDAYTYHEVAAYYGGNGVSFSADSRYIATGNSLYVLLYDMNSEELIRRFDGAGQGATISPDGKYVASHNGFDCTLFLWDVATGNLITSQHTRNCQVRNIVFTPDSGSLITVFGNPETLERNAGFWYTRTGQLYKSITVMGDRVTLSPDTKYIGNPYEIIDAERKNKTATISGWKSPINSLTFSPDSKRLAGDNHIWTISGGNPIITMEGYGSDFYNQSTFAPDGKTLVHTNGLRVVLWDTKTHSVKMRIDKRGTSLAYSPDGKILAIGLWGGQNVPIILWDIQRGREFGTLNGHNKTLTTLAFHPNGYILASGGKDGTIRLWNVRNGKLVSKMTHQNREINCVAFGPDGNLLASVGADNSVMLWNGLTGNHIATLTEHKSYIRSVVFSSDAKLLASSDMFGEINIWDANTHRLVRKIKIIRNPETVKMNQRPFRFNSLAFSPDSLILAAGSWESEVFLFDVATGKVEQKLEGHGAGVWSVNFSPDGKTLASTDSSGVAYLWELASEKPPQLNTQIENPKTNTSKHDRPIKRGFDPLLY